MSVRCAPGRQDKQCRATRRGLVAVRGGVRSSFIWMFMYSCVCRPLRTWEVARGKQNAGLCWCFVSCCRLVDELQVVTQHGEKPRKHQANVKLLI